MYLVSVLVHRICSMWLYSLRNKSNYGPLRLSCDV